MSTEEFEQELNNIAASYQKVIVDTLFQKLHLCLQDNAIKKISIVGGVSANKYFRNRAKEFSSKNNYINIEFPDFKFCTDNAAMIAMAGYLKLKNNFNINENINSIPNLNF